MGTQSFLRVWVEQFFKKIFALGSDLVLFCSDLRPIYISFADIIENCLNSIIGEWWRSNDHLIGDDS